MDILKNGNKEEEDGILNDENINEDILRTKEEFEKFKKIDKERYLNEKKEERLEEIKNKLD